MDIETVIVPLDGSREARAALPVARGLAKATGARIRLVHVTALPGRAAGDVAREIGLGPRDLEEAVLDLRHGEPAQEIFRAARECPGPTVVMTTRAGPVLPEHLLGRIAEEGLMEATSPVLLVRPEREERPWSLRSLVLAHDGTPTTTGVVGPIADLVRQAGARLSVLYVAGDEQPLPQEPGSMTGPRYLDEPQHEWPAWAGEFLERLGAASSLEGLDLRLALGHGDPARQVLDFARRTEADLVVMAWRGKLEADRARVFQAVLADAPCPVMVLRAPLSRRRFQRRAADRRP